MKTIKRMGVNLFVIMLSVFWMFAVSVSAEEYYEESYSGDNSLYSLGLENATSCSPDFYYSTLDYNITVEKGTKELELSPITSASSANIVDISGTELDEDGNGTVTITVEADNGARVSYYLHVTSDGVSQTAETEAEDATEKETEMSDEAKQAAAESEALARESERYALEQAQAQVEQKTNQVSLLQAENDDLAYRLDLLMKVLYGLVGFSVILLFFIINQSLRNKDLKDDNKKLRKQAEENYDFARTTEYYYSPVQAGAQQPQRPIYTTPVKEPTDEPAPSKKELKRMEKEAKKAAKKSRGKKAEPEMNVEQPYQQMVVQPAPQQPVQPIMQQVPQQPVVQQPVYHQPAPQQPVQPIQTPQQPTMVQSTVDEPDVQVDMIDL